MSWIRRWFCRHSHMIYRLDLNGQLWFDCDNCGLSVPAIERTEDELAAMREKFRAVSAPKAERRRTTMRRVR